MRLLSQSQVIGKPKPKPKQLPDYFRHSIENCSVDVRFSSSSERLKLNYVIYNKVSHIALTFSLTLHVSTVHSTSVLHTSVTSY